MTCTHYFLFIRYSKKSFGILLYFGIIFISVIDAITYHRGVRVGGKWDNSNSDNLLE